MFPSRRKTRVGEEMMELFEVDLVFGSEESMATPAESYPLYSKRLRPLNSTCRIYLLSLFTL